MDVWHENMEKHLCRRRIALDQDIEIPTLIGVRIDSEENIDTPHLTKIIDPKK